MVFGPEAQPWVCMVYPEDVDREVDGESGWDFFELGDVVFQADDLYSLQRVIIGGAQGRGHNLAIMTISDSVDEAIRAAEDLLGPVPAPVLEKFRREQ